MNLLESLDRQSFSQIVAPTSSQLYCSRLNLMSVYCWTTPHQGSFKVNSSVTILNDDTVHDSNPLCLL